MRRLLAFGLLALATVAGAAEQRGLRVVYAYPRVGAVDLRLSGPDGAKAEQLGLGAPGCTPWLPLAWTKGELTIKPAGADGDPLIASPFELPASGRATLIALRPADEPKVVVVPDAPPAIDRDKAAVRWVNALPGPLPVTLTVTRSTGQTAVPVGKQVLPFGMVGDWQVVEPGPLVMRATTNDKDSPLDWEVASLRPLPGVAYTVVLLGLPSPGSDELGLTVLPLVDRLP